MGHYFLVGHKHYLEPDLLKWAAWFEKSGTNRRVELTKRNDITVSTVFLGIDHRFGNYGPPLLFETMVFGGEFDQEMERYSTWDEAELGHNEMCKKVFGGGE